MLREQVSFNDGIAEIYTVDNISEDGDKPRDGLVNKRTVCYDDRTVGMSRYFEAQQANVRIDRLIRIPRGPLVTTQSVVILRSEGDGQYKVKQVQLIKDTKPESVLVSLERIEQEYEVTEIPRHT